MAYVPAVYRTSGGDEQVVASGGDILIESGGIQNIASGGALQIGGTNFISSGSKIDLSSGRNWISSGVYVSTAGGYVSAMAGVKEYIMPSSTAGALNAYGIVTVKSSGAYTITPVANARVTIVNVTSAGSTSVATVVTTGVFGNGSATTITYTTAANGVYSGIELIGVSATQFYILSPLSTTAWSLS